MAARVLFVCLGNICRSPTAEGVMRAMLEEADLAGHVEVESAGTGSWHIGHPPDERATEAARRRGIELEGAARRVEPEDLERFDHVVAMDRDNLSELRRMARHEDHERKLSLLRQHDEDAVQSGDLEVPDPYYGGDDGFEVVLDVVAAGCRGLIARISAERI